jgi:hypothetical protein
MSTSLFIGLLVALLTAWAFVIHAMIRESPDEDLDGRESCNRIRELTEL